MLDYLHPEEFGMSNMDFDSRTNQPTQNKIVKSIKQHMGRWTSNYREFISGVNHYLRVFRRTSKQVHWCPNVVVNYPYGVVWFSFDLMFINHGQMIMFRIQPCLSLWFLFQPFFRSFAIGNHRLRTSTIVWKVACTRTSCKRFCPWSNMCPLSGAGICHIPP